jgi:hypothetical protein
MYWKKIFSRTSRPILIKLDKNYLCIKGMYVCTKKGPGPLQREIIAKIGWCHLKYFFSRTSLPEKLRFTQKLPDIVQIEIY